MICRRPISIVRKDTIMSVVVDIYCRISTDPQEDGTSLDEQERCGREYCAAHGLTVGMVHREIFTGYQYRERKKLSLMRDRYRDGNIQGVIIRTLDRLSRSQVHNAILMEEMEHHKITLYCVKEAIDDTPMGKFTRMILSFVAEMEREKIMDRTMTGRINRAKQGEVREGPKPLYGYQWHDEQKKDYRVIDEIQADVCRWVHVAFDHGTGRSYGRSQQKTLTGSGREALFTKYCQTPGVLARTLRHLRGTKKTRKSHLRQLTCRKEPIPRS